MYGLLQKNLHDNMVCEQCNSRMLKAKSGGGIQLVFKNKYDFMRKPEPVKNCSCKKLYQLFVQALQKKKALNRFITECQSLVRKTTRFSFYAKSILGYRRRCHICRQKVSVQLLLCEPKMGKASQVINGLLRCYDDNNDTLNMGRGVPQNYVGFY